MKLNKLSDLELALYDIHTERANVYVIDDSDEIQNLFKVFMKPEKDFLLNNYVDEMEFLNDLYAEKIKSPDLIVIDINLKMLHGEMIHQMIKEYYSEEVPVVFISTNQFRENLSYPFFKKPLQKQDIKDILKIAYDRAA